MGRELNPRHRPSRILTHRLLMRHRDRLEPLAKRRVALGFDLRHRQAPVKALLEHGQEQVILTAKPP